jgi:glycerophosphoryl diester phosphodiesterase
MVSISAPYRWDGKLFNSEFETTIVNPDAETMCVKSVNHRGYGTAPENTLSAYKLSAQNGFKYVECDVRFTLDEVAVLLHDEIVDTTSNGSGKISEMTLAEARTLDFGSKKSTKYAGEKIPTFEEFLKLCKVLGLHPYIELKGEPTSAQIMSLVTSVKKYGMLRNCTWISFSSQALEKVKEADTEARLGFLCYQLTMSNLRTTESLKNGANEVFVDVRYDGIMSGTNGTGYGYNEAIATGIPVETWTINTASELVSTMENYPYISGVTSDIIHAGRELYKAYK